MQHPVAYRINPEKHRAELTNIVEVLTQKTAVVTFLHTIPSAAFAAGASKEAVETPLGWRGRQISNPLSC